MDALRTTLQSVSFCLWRYNRKKSALHCNLLSIWLSQCRFLPDFISYGFRSMGPVRPPPLKRNAHFAHVIHWNETALYFCDRVRKHRFVGNLFKHGKLISFHFAENTVWTLFATSLSILVDLDYVHKTVWCRQIYPTILKRTDYAWHIK